MFASSCFVIPVSCTGGMFAGASWLSHHNTLFFDEVLQPSENFYVLANNDTGLDYFDYKGSKSVKAYLGYYPKSNFLLEKEIGKLSATDSLSEIEYQVIRQGNGLQTIKLAYSLPDEADVTVQYKATENTIKPISQRFYGSDLLKIKTTSLGRGLGSKALTFRT